MTSETASVQIDSIPSKGSNANVKKDYTPPDGYSVALCAAFASSGCMASGNYSLASKVLTAVVYNPTDIARQPYVNWYILLKKSQ